MKLRIKGNSIRLRVSRSDLAALAENGSIESAIYFADSPAAMWSYGIVQHRAVAGSSVYFDSNRVTVSVGSKEVNKWANSEDVGIYFSQNIGSQGTLDVLLEKDFACLDRSDEENSDTFPNPNEACAVQ
jgi:hypothetical protein